MNHCLINVEAHDHDLLSQIARIHVQEIPDGFLTMLGRKVLADLYQTIAQSDGSFLVAIISAERRVLGFLAGRKGTHSLYREFLRLGNLGSKIRLIAALSRPSRVLLILETLRYSEDHGTSPDLPHAEILNFCVSLQGQRQGLGKQLMSAAETIFKKAKINQVRIVTGHSQKSAQEFYRKFGARWISDIEIHKGTPSSMFVWDVGVKGLPDKKR